MAAAVPTVEPSLLVAGDTWAWRREDLGDYPASDGWTLTYALVNASAKITINAAADGAAFAVTVPAATTAPYAAGLYAVEGYVSKAGERYRVFRGSLRVQANLAAATTLDTRSHPRKVLDAIEALIEGRGDVQDYSIGDRRLAKMPIAELLKWRDHYRDEVARELAAEQARKGKSAGRMVLTRFPGR